MLSYCVSHLLLATANVTAFPDMSGVLTVLIAGLLVGREAGLAISDDEFTQTDGRSSYYKDYDASPSTGWDDNSRPAEPAFDDHPSDSLDETPIPHTKSDWNTEAPDTYREQSQEESETSTPAPQKNIFIYVPFRPSDSRLRQRNRDVRDKTTTTTTTTSTTTTTTPKPKLARDHPTLRTTFSSAWPPVDSPSLRSISRSSPDYKGVETKWKPMSGLKESASSSIYTQAAAPILQSPTHVLQSPPTLLLAPPQPVAQQPVFHHVQQAPLVQDVRIVEAAPQPQPVQVSVVQSPPVAAPPVQLNILRAAPQPAAVHVDFVRAHPQTIVHQPVLHAPLVQQRLIQAPPVLTHIVQAPHIHAHPVVHAPLLRAPVFHAAPAVFAPFPAAPPCPSPAFSPPLHAVPHTFFSPPQPQRTRTVFQQVQFVPEQTHVYTTTSYSPATRTTIYEADHVAAFSAPKAHVVRAPHSPALLADRNAATIYTFPKMRILGAPIRLAGRLSSRRQLRQRLREERIKEQHQKGKEKKILVFNRRNSA